MCVERSLPAALRSRALSRPSRALASHAVPLPLQVGPVHSGHRLLPRAASAAAAALPAVSRALRVCACLRARLLVALTGHPSLAAAPVVDLRASGARAHTPRRRRALLELRADHSAAVAFGALVARRLSFGRALQRGIQSAAAT